MATISDSSLLFVLFTKNIMLQITGDMRFVAKSVKLILYLCFFCFYRARFDFHCADALAFACFHFRVNAFFHINLWLLVSDLYCK